MGIILNEENISRINTLLNICPESFSYAPLKIHHDDDGSQIASIQMSDINASVIYGAKTKLEPIEKFADDDELEVKLSMSRNTVNALFNSNFTYLDLSKSKIVGKGDNRKISIALYEVINENVFVKKPIPFNNVDILPTTLGAQKAAEVPQILAEIDNNEIRDMLDCMSVLNNPEAVIFTSNGNEVIVTSEDLAKNSIEYKLNMSGPIFSSKYIIASDKVPTSIIKIFRKIMKYDTYKTTILLSELMTAFTITGDNFVATIGIPAATA